MSTTNIKILLVIIVLVILGWFVVRTIMRKKKREEIFKVTKTKYEDIKKLFIDSGEALERAEQIAKTDDEITLFNKWYKEYKDIEVQLTDLDTDYQEVYKYFEKGQHKDFLESNKSLGFKIDTLKEQIDFLHQRLFNYTSYELENTQIALDLKTTIKEVQNQFEVNLAVKEFYTKSFEIECEKVERELIRFEDLQKSGMYTKARKHLKNATELTNKLEYNYAIITNTTNECDKLENNISIIDKVSEQISERKFRLDQDEYLQNYDDLKQQKASIVSEVEGLDFSEKITEEFVVSKEREIAEIQDSIFNIKQSIEEQYSQIKVIEEHILANAELFEQSESLIEGAIEERDEINTLYQMPNEKAILKLETEINRYYQFKKDYEVLLDLVYDLKEDYRTLAARVAKSNEFIKHFIANMQSAIEGLKDIRTDEIKALESIGSYKSGVTLVELYLSSNEHIHQMSRSLSDVLSEAYGKINLLDQMLQDTPLNITEVRKLTHASESLLADLETQAEEEIKVKTNAQALIKFANRFVEDKKSQDQLSHAMTLYNNQSYVGVVKEIRQMIYNDFESPELLYKQVLEGCTYQTIANYKKGEVMYYFDYASTTQPSDKILSVYTKLLRDVYLHPEPTNNAGKLLVEASNMITTSLQLNNSYDVIFTSGGTEANNLAIIGYAQNFTSSKHFITSKYEHSSVYSSFKHLESQGHQVTYLNILENGQIDYQQLADEITENTVMVAIMAVNNELGTANDCDRIRKIIDSHEHNIIYFSDCVQAAGKLDYSYSNLDMITITGHKLYAPKGIGLLAYKRNIKLNNTIYGGQQQDGIRPGTICTASAVTLGYALKTEIGQLSDTIEHTTKLMNRFINFVMEHPKIELNCQPSCSIVSVNFKTKALSESIVSVLNGSDIYASTRSACSRKLNIPSRSLTSIGLSNEKVDRTIRFSFSHLSSLEDVEYLITKLTEILEIY